MVQDLPSPPTAGGSVIADKGYISDKDQRASYIHGRVRLIPEQRRNMSDNTYEDATLILGHRSRVVALNNQLDKMGLQRLHAQAITGCLLPRMVMSFLLLILGCVVFASSLSHLQVRPAPVMHGSEFTAAGDSKQVHIPPNQESVGRDALSSEAGTGAQIAMCSLGTLQPQTGLLPSGTTSLTLSLTTTFPANCRWSDEFNTPYTSMTHDFQHGQGTEVHFTVVAGLHDLDDRWYYVRCQDLVLGRNPDHCERQTHVRVLGPWDSGYPRLVNLYGSYDPEIGPGLFAGYDLYIPYSLFDPVDQASAVRSISSSTKILHYQYATKAWPEQDPLVIQWQKSQPGDRDYICLLRDSHGELLRYSDHPMYNLTIDHCRTAVARKNVEEFLSSEPDLGANLAYDGIYWDVLGDGISWLGRDIDSDLDGLSDDPDVLDAAYQAGVEEFLAQVRAGLPNVLLLGNGSPTEYGHWINGRIFETGLSSILDNPDGGSWDSLVSRYRDWARKGQSPQITILMATPEAIYWEKHSREYEPHILTAFQAEAAASYQRMRFGLTSALMGDGLFLYDLGEVDRPREWYDEFGAPGSDGTTHLPPGGYLGKPVGDPFVLGDILDTPDQILNGGFENGLNNWSFWTNTDAQVAATAKIDSQSGVSGSAAAHLTVSSATRSGAGLLLQYDRTTMAGQSYTLSFWARSDSTRTVEVEINQRDFPGTHYGFRVRAMVTPEWQQFQLWDDATVTASDGALAFEISGDAGELWLDDVKFQAGALGVWARPFENGLAVVNATRESQTVPLPGVYCKLDGDQAPLFQARVDDDEAQTSVGWSNSQADREQFGKTVRLARGGSLATVTYSPILAYDGEYEVLAWVAPGTTQSNAVSVTIHHAQGNTVAFLDETIGEVGWHSLGTYPFPAGEQGRAVLSATGSGTVVADAFKWVSSARYNDGSQVNQVTLQPLDGIVLLSSCYISEQ